MKIKIAENVTLICTIKIGSKLFAMSDFTIIADADQKIEAIIIKINPRDFLVKINLSALQILPPSKDIILPFQNLFLKNKDLIIFYK